MAEVGLSEPASSSTVMANAEARTVTARHILSHSSGFPNWRSGVASKPAPELVPAFSPGTRFQYSGEAFFYLQRVLERIRNGVEQPRELAQSNS